ncbi:DUF1015 domain-containing protein [Streptomyces kunmingensis]|uniref:DUF1015 domain-containing protein n=1 Tax=Streptomyces kunmingensis TaxID=68225 RepID=A0ABU6CGG9_9ACTN|nr:DUF1015 domain-containing protein [Streptomyces kunmingensis]MEB3963717.1 DUF1015 domain-containing protein [Streptomyces kunmingensis]
MEITAPGPAAVRGGLQLRPFRGLRYVPERAGQVGALTAVTADGVRDAEPGDPFHIVRLLLPRGRTTADRSADAVRTLAHWLSEGVIAADPEPALYVCEQRGDGFSQCGIVGALRLPRQGEDVVLPHEDVFEHVVADRAAVLRATAAQLEPMLLAYQGDAGPDGAGGVVERTVRRPALVTAVMDDGVRHRLWAVTDPAELARIDADLRGRQAMIVDGHHRWATYLRVRDEVRSGAGPRAEGDWDFGLALLVDTERYPFRVRAIHRVLRRLPVARALAAVEGAFRVREVRGELAAAMEASAEAAGGTGNALLLAGGAAGEFHLLDRPDPALLARTVPGDRPAAWRELDATVLHSTLLAHVWGVPDEPEEIGYVHDAAAAVEQARREGGTAVLMRPVGERTVRELAGVGVRLPRKSTSFGPKPATGLVMRSLDEPPVP